MAKQHEEQARQKFADNMRDAAARAKADAAASKAKKAAKKTVRQRTEPKQG